MSEPLSELVTLPVSNNFRSPTTTSRSGPSAVDGLDGIVDAHKEVHDRDRWQPEQYMEALWCC